MNLQERAKEVVVDNNGIAKSADFVAAGIRAVDVVNLCNAGFLNRVRHGYYQLAEQGVSSEEQLLATLIPKGIVCVESALFHYGYSDFAPRKWSIAVPRSMSRTKLKVDSLAIQPYYMQPELYELGKITDNFNGVELPVYDRERTICDCFKYRSRLDNEIFNKAINAYVKDDKKNLNNLRKNVGIVFQDADNQIIASTVMAEVSFGPMNLKLPREEVISRVDKALEYMNISGFKDRPPHYLSGGEKKRVSIADIIAMESEVIIFDEPTAALDPLNAAMLEEVLQKMGDEGRTMLISTHDVDFAYRWAERVIVFCHGKIIADDTPLAVFKQEDILKQANLKHPMMFDVYDILKEKGIVPKGDVYPKNIAEFQAMVKGL